MRGDIDRLPHIIKPPLSIGTLQKPAQSVWTELVVLRGAAMTRRPGDKKISEVLLQYFLGLGSEARLFRFKHLCVNARHVSLCKVIASRDPRVQRLLLEKQISFLLTRMHGSSHPLCRLPFDDRVWSRVFDHIPQIQVFAPSSLLSIPKNKCTAYDVRQNGLDSEIPWAGRVLCSQIMFVEEGLDADACISRSFAHEIMRWRVIYQLSRARLQL
jgi:hypothetical protein